MQKTPEFRGKSRQETQKGYGIQERASSCSEQFDLFNLKRKKKIKIEKEKVRFFLFFFLKSKTQPGNAFALHRIQQMMVQIF